MSSRGRCTSDPSKREEVNCWLERGCSRNTSVRTPVVVGITNGGDEDDKDEDDEEDDEEGGGMRS